MNIEQIREWCLEVNEHVTEDMPFSKLGYEDIAFRIGGKIFAYLLTDGSNLLVLKCDPQRAIELRESYPYAIEPAFHWNKKYWNQIHYDSHLISSDLTKSLIHHAFCEASAKLTKKIKTELGLLQQGISSEKQSTIA